MRRWLTILLGMVFLFTAATAAELGKTTTDLSAKNIRTQETTLGNFIADAVRDAVKADVAVIQATAFREETLIGKGSIDEQAMRDALTSPTSSIVTLAMKPALLRKMMERALGKLPDANTSFLQIAGMTVTFDSSKPQGARIDTILVGGKSVNFLDDKTTYTVAMPRELGVGGAGYLRVFPEEVINAMTTSEVTLMDAIGREFVKSKGEISPKIEGRLKDTAPKA